MVKPDDQVDAPQAAFATTRWSVVLAANRKEEGIAAETARQALVTLCETYWYPLYAFVRRQGYAPQDAEDLTQGFFARLLEHRDLGTVHPDRGKFRTYLLACLTHYLANQRDRQKTLKRGGGIEIVSLESQSAEHRYRHEPVEHQTAETIYQRSWAMTVLDQTMLALRAEFQQGGREDLFDCLKEFLTGERAAVSQAEIAARFGMSTDAVKAAVYRLRKRFARRLRDQIAQTVAGPDDVESELRELWAALG